MQVPAVFRSSSDGGTDIEGLLDLTTDSGRIHLRFTSSTSADAPRSVVLDLDTSSLFGAHPIPSRIYSEMTGRGWKPRVRSITSILSGHTGGGGGGMGVNNTHTGTQSVQSTPFASPRASSAAPAPLISVMGSGEKQQQQHQQQQQQQVSGGNLSAYTTPRTSNVNSVSVAAASSHLNVNTSIRGRTSAPSPPASSSSAKVSQTGTSNALSSAVKPLTTLPPSAHDTVVPNALHPVPHWIRAWIGENLPLRTRVEGTHVPWKVMRLVRKYRQGMASRYPDQLDQAVGMGGLGGVMVVDDITGRRTSSAAPGMTSPSGNLASPHSSSSTTYPNPSGDGEQGGVGQPETWDLVVFGLRWKNYPARPVVGRANVVFWRFGILASVAVVDALVHQLHLALNIIPASMPGQDETQQLTQQPRRLKHVLVLVNPFGGTKQAPEIWRSIVEPMLDVAGVHYTHMNTERAGHAMDIGQSFELDYDAVATISGDGLFHELINGVMSRPDWQDAVRRVPLCIIPGGSGNALAKSVDTPFPEYAALSLIQTQSIPFDLFAFKHLAEPEKPVRYGFLEVMWALIADVDIESDRIRWAGNLRFTLWAVLRLVMLRVYLGTLYYLPGDASGAGESSDTEKSQAKGSENVRPTKWAHDFTMDNFRERVSGKEWKSLTAPFSYFMAMNAPWCATDTLIAPYCHLDNGLLDLVWMQNVTRFNLLKFLLDTESGKYVREKFTHTEKCQAFVLVPGGLWDGKSLTSELRLEDTLKSLETRQSEEAGILDVDGEKVTYGAVMVECVGRAARLVVPGTHDQRVWSAHLDG